MPFGPEHKLAAFAVAVGGSLAVALGAWPLLIRQSRLRALNLAVVVGLIFLAPAVVSPQTPFLRFFTACVAFFIAARVIEYARCRARSGAESLGFRDYLILHVHPLALTLDASRRLLPRGCRRSPELIRLCAGILVFLGAAVAMRALVAGEIGRSSFVIDHSLKVVLLLAGLEAASQALLAAGRLARLDARPVIDICFLSLTPGEFWRRYNTLVGSWLRENVYIPAGGKRHRAFAVVLTFGVSGLAHEYVFGMALQEITGYQMSFFLMQALAVILFPAPDRSRLTRPQALAAWGGTMLFLWLSSILFLASLAQVLPGFYASRPWLP